MNDENFFDIFEIENDAASPPPTSMPMPSLSPTSMPMPTPSQLPPLVLAYVGDSVYEMYVRGMLAARIAGSVHKLHVEATEYSRCGSQADVIKNIEDKLTEHERDIVRRGRNANSGYIPKNASVTEYRHATGFETLIGYLYLSRDYGRLNQILGYAAQRVGERITESKSHGRTEN